MSVLNWGTTRRTLRKVGVPYAAGSCWRNTYICFGNNHKSNKVTEKQNIRGTKYWSRELRIQMTKVVI